MIYTIIILIFTLGYIGLILYYLKEWNTLKPFEISVFRPSTRVSVIIPARDESDSILSCVQSILKQNYPSELFEIIVMDDHSTDDTAKKVESLELPNVHLIRMSEIKLNEHEVAYKKRSIEVGVNKSTGSLIVTTDADCVHHPDWLHCLVQDFEQNNSNIISAPVLFQYNKSIFERFQALDFIGMLGITAASLNAGMYNLANGANLAFRKSIFKEVGGYKGIDSKASGDDMLLIYKFAQIDASKVHFLKSSEATVLTSPANTLNEFIQQRLRWTSKSFNYQDSRITLILAFVYLVNLFLVISLIGGIFTFNLKWLWLFLCQFTLMSVVDYIFLNKVCSFFGKKELLRSFLPSQFLHVAYIIVIGLLGNVVKYKWKGRKLK